MTKEEWENGLFLPYINGRYVNPYIKGEKNPDIRKKNKKEKVYDSNRR
jgi:hypothetical protein